MIIHVQITLEYLVNECFAHPVIEYSILMNAIIIQQCFNALIHIRLAGSINCRSINNAKQFATANHLSRRICMSCAFQIGDFKCVTFALVSCSPFEAH